MATVRFSGSLRDSIIHNAEAMFTKRIHEAEARRIPELDTGFYNAAFKDEISSMNALPKWFFSRRDDYTIQDMSGLDAEFKYQRYTIQFGSSKPWPREIPRGEHGICSTSYSGLTLDASDPRWHDMIPAYKEWCSAINKLKKEQRDFAGSVQIVITRYSTLAPALKAWPPLWDLVPLEAKDRHRQVKESRTKNDPMLDDLNLDQMSSTVIADKITR